MITSSHRRKAAPLPHHLLAALRQRVADEGPEVVAATLDVDARSVRRYTQPTGPKGINFALRERLVRELGQRIGTEPRQADDGGRYGPLTARCATMEAITDRYPSGMARLWDLPVGAFSDGMRAASDINADLAAVNERLRGRSDVSDPQRLAIARLAMAFADVSFAVPALEPRRTEALSLGVSIVAPLLCCRNEDQSREARLLTAQLLRAEEGELWSFVRRPTAAPGDALHVLNIYDESSHHLKWASGGGVGPNSAPDDRRRYAINEICRARTLLQHGLVKEGEAALASAPGMLGRVTPMIRIYRSHLRVAEGKVEAALADLELARAGYTGLGSEIGAEAADACVVRMYEVSGSCEFAARAAGIVDRPGMRWKYADTACFECVERMLGRRRGHGQRHASRRPSRD